VGEAVESGGVAASAAGDVASANPSRPYRTAVVPRLMIIASIKPPRPPKTTVRSGAFDALNCRASTASSSSVVSPGAVTRNTRSTIAAVTTAPVAD
jgi:hypothetical protein